ncbi:MAG: T9SS type A sorting domain-containing protein [Lewinellaceae bacterium]|nr:T9SS type A sorting domain-containing protein [Lewinellaceae bacterium]
MVVTAGEVTTLDVLANDFTLNQVVSLTILGTPTQGSATVNPDFTIDYISFANSCGDDEFTYVVCDADICDTATVFIDLRCYPVYTIAQVTGETATGAADSIGVNCELEGIVYGVNIRPINGGVSSLLFTLIDASGNGIAVSRLSGDLGYTVQEKDRIKVRGRIGQFNGLTEIQPDFITLVSTDNALLSPLPVTNLGEETDSKLIKINNLHFVDAATDWTTGVGASGFNVRAVSDDHPNDTIQIRIDRDVETYNAAVPAQPFNLTGLGGQFDASSPFDAGYQILPRYNADISTLNSAKEADFSQNVVLSPNPVVDLLDIRTNMSFDRIVLMGSNGQRLQMFERPDLSVQVEMRQQPAGVYFLQFQKNGAVWTAKFVKQ